jgi:hypothetical protein
MIKNAFLGRFSQLLVWKSFFSLQRQVSEDRHSLKLSIFFADEIISLFEVLRTISFPHFRDIIIFRVIFRKTDTFFPRTQVVRYGCLSNYGLKIYFILPEKRL